MNGEEDLKRNIGALEQFLRKRIEEKGYPGVVSVSEVRRGFFLKKGLAIEA